MHMDDMQTLKKQYINGLVLVGIEEIGSLTKGYLWKVLEAKHFHFCNSFGSCETIIGHRTHSRPMVWVIE